VNYSEAERTGHALLAEYARLRTGSPRRNDLVTLLLKKRLFSSPAAFARTLERHAESLTGAKDDYRDPDDAGYDWDDDAAGSEPEAALLFGSATSLTPAAATALQKLQAWVRSQLGPADAKAERLVAELEQVCRPGGEWDDERVVVFTEYVDTQTWLAGLLGARGLGGDRLGLLFGGMDEKRREHLKAAFQASPERDPVRILVATDAASEGIDLQEHCCRVINYDIPFNPNRLEQRIGRVDRFGQRRPVHVAHFVGSGWRSAPEGSYEADLEFLSRVAQKVAQEREDLGRVNPVLAQAVESRMLGRPFLDDPFAPSPAVALVKAERDLRDQAARLRQQLSRSTESLHVPGPNVARVVQTALAMAGQPPLTKRADGLFDAPNLTRGWERTLEGIEDPLDPMRRRPLTFDAERRGPDVVHAPLGWRLVDQAQRLLRSAVWDDRSAFAKVGGVSAELPEDVRPGELLVTVLTRFLLVGADGSRLHEEVVLAARAVPPTGRSRRLELEERRFEVLRRTVEAALDPGACHPASPAACQRLAQTWPELKDLLSADVSARAEQRKASLERDLGQRLEEDVSRVDAITEHMRATLSDALKAPAPVQLRLDQLDQPERHQLEADRAAWKARLDDLDRQRDQEHFAIERRYLGARSLSFPMAVVLVARPEPL